MFESYTYESILESALARVDSSYDKREGSIIYDAIAPACAELAQMYAALDIVLQEVFADTADRAYLIRRAYERNLTPYDATYALVKGIFDIEIEIGARFNSPTGDVNFYATEYLGEEDGYYVYSLTCETAGEAGNECLGEILPIENISGLGKAEIIEILEYGEEEEDTEDFRQRYYDSINNISFGGNVAEYKEVVGAMDGVGAVRVYRADDWLGAGTVKIAVAAPGGEAPSEELVEKIKEELDPSDYTGDGIGLAPIGHQVTVVGATKLEVNIGLKAVIDEDYAEDDVISEIEEAIEEYIDSVNENWADDSNTAVVYISGIIAAVKGVDGVTDVYDVSINGESGNVTLEGDSLAVCGEIEVEVVEE